MEREAGRATGRDGGNVRLHDAALVVIGLGFRRSSRVSAFEDDEARVVVIQRAAHRFEHRRPQRVRVRVVTQRVVDVEQQLEAVALSLASRRYCSARSKYDGILDRYRQLPRDLPQQHDLRHRKRIRVGAAHVQDAVRAPLRLEGQAHARLHTSSDQRRGYFCS